MVREPGGFAGRGEGVEEEVGVFGGFVDGVEGDVGGAGGGEHFCPFYCHYFRLLFSFFLGGLEGIRELVYSGM